MDNMKVKFFTLEEANTLLPSMEQIISRVLVVKERLAISLIQAGELKAKAAGNGSRVAFKEKLEETVKLHEQLSNYHMHLIEQGVVVRDYDKGLIDFPTIISGDLGYFCWKAGEDHVTHWHPVGEGYRQILTDDLTLLKQRSDNLGN